MVDKYKKYFGIALSLFIFLVPAFIVHAECESSCPVVIIPGILASFDKKLMYQDEEDNKWSFVPFGNVYKALVKEFENYDFYDYENGKTLFVAHYDWRKPVSENWEKYLKPKIEEAKQKSGQDKVDLVAHSMGGLLARAYIQSDSYDNDVNKLVMMGTPNYGASESYIALEGGLYPKTWTYPVKLFINSIEGQLKRVRNKKELTRPSTFREFFPALRDLLPTTTFIKKGDGMLELSSMADKNSFLIDLNNNAAAIKDMVREVKTYSGKTGKTMDQISLSNNRTIDDEKNQRWRDGHPDPETPTANSSEGDETVLLSSVTIPEILNQTLEGTSHTKIPDDARSDILWFLNPGVLSKGNSFQRFFAGFFSHMTVHAQEENPDLYVEPNSMLSFTVSPNIYFEVIDPDGKIVSRDKNELGEDNAYFDDDPDDDTDIVLVVIRNPKVGKYVLRLKGNSAGDYYVDSTYVNANGNFEDSSEGTITQREEKTFESTVSETDGVVFPSDEKEDNSNDNSVPDNRREISSGPNTALDKPRKKGGSVLGVATVRAKLSDTIISVQNKLSVLLQSKKAGDPKITKVVYQTLMGPLNDMLTRARMYEIAVASKKAKLAASLLQKTKEDYRDFANKVDKLIAAGKLNKQTTDVLVALKQRLEKAGLR